MSRLATRPPRRAISSQVDDAPGWPDAGNDYREHFVGAHDAVAMAVQNGNAQAGGLSKPIFESLVDRHLISLDKVKVLSVSKPFPNILGLCAPI